MDIINLSLSTESFASFYDLISLAIEEAFRLGVLTVVAFGNTGNAPYNAGAVATTPNAIACASTGKVGSENERVMEKYSARGPGDNNIIKPDLAAPSRSFVARAGTGTKYSRLAGTSFSAPIISGSAALIKGQCPTCSPFAVKAILMNNAYRDIKAGTNSTMNAPITWMGSGEIRTGFALEADFWAYSPDQGGIQPSLSLGLVNAATDLVIQRRIKVVSLTPDTHVLSTRSVFRDPDDEMSGAIYIVTSPAELSVNGCQEEAAFDVEFRIDAAKAPSNFMNSGGVLGSDPTTLDKNEFDGHIIISSKQTGKEISLAFHAILRRAADISISNATLPASTESNSTVVEIENRGAGVGQIDAYELLALSEDDPEASMGQPNRPADLRAAGYRTLEVGRPGCSFVLEFAFTLWERVQHLVPTFVYAKIRTDGDEYVLAQSGFYSRNIGCTVINMQTNEELCTGFPVDHGTNTGNIILRACAEDLGIRLLVDTASKVLLKGISILVATTPSRATQ